MVRPAGRAADAAFLGELERILAEQEALLDDPVGFIDRDRAFHRAIVRQAGNLVLAEFYETLRERQIRMGVRAIASQENRARTVLDEHAAIVRALAEGMPARHWRPTWRARWPSCGCREGFREGRARPAGQPGRGSGP